MNGSPRRQGISHEGRVLAGRTLAASDRIRTTQRVGATQPADRDQPADRGLGQQAAGCRKGVEAVATSA